MSLSGWIIKRSLLSILAFSLLISAPVLLAAIEAEYLFDLEAGFSHPSAVRISDQGRAYVLDGVNGRVVMFDREGKEVGVFSTPGNTPFNLPMDLQIHRDQVIVADSGNHRLLLFDLEGVYLRALNLSGDGLEQPPEPTGLAVIEGVVYWSDRANSRICATVLKTGNQLRCWGGFGTAEGEFRYPFMMTTDKDNYLFVVDVLNGRIQVFNERGRPFGALERFGVKNQSLLRPNGISMGNSDLMMVSDAYNGKILLFRGRSFAGLLLDHSGNAAHFEQPVGIARWQDRIYVVEMAQHRVRVLRVEEQDNQSMHLPAAYFSKPIRRDCVTCHLSWSEDYTRQGRQSDPVPPVGSKQMCMSCHHGAVIDSRMSLGQGEQHPDHYHPSKDEIFSRVSDRDDPLPEAFPLLGDNTLYCGTCHTPHRYSDDDTGLTSGHENLWMRDNNQDSEICRHCHESLYAEGVKASRKMGMHPVSIDLDEAVEIDGVRVERLNCQSCHKVHGGEKESALLAVSREDVGQLCATCHERYHAESLEQARQNGVHPTNMELQQSVSINDREITRIDCLSCHAVHQGIEQTPSLVMDHDNGRLCEVCHEETLDVIDTDHDFRLSAPESRNRLDETPAAAGVCGSCHSMHRGSAAQPYLSVGDELPEGAESSHLARDRLCLGCHRDDGIGEKRVIKDYSHPYQDLVMHSDLDSMPLLDNDETMDSFGQIGCITCHNPHVWSPRRAYPSLAESYALDKEQDGTVMESFLRPEQIEESFCIECHGLETRIKYKYYHDHRGRPNKAEYLR
jgi:predicted CXXCH cytochrome family protein